MDTAVDVQSVVPTFSQAAQRADVILDMVHLRTFTGGCPDFEREILGLFAGELQRTIAALERATNPRDWHAAAHTLKGSALSVGAFGLAAAARAAEALKTPDHPGRNEAIARVRRSVIDVLAEGARLKLL